ncbi:MAG: DUF4291 domain-containing protein [Bacteroidetes bacterium]|nr:DUF4291 domain-containing protein [Bacteroidota bacterium]
MNKKETGKRVIRAKFDPNSITVYQAFSDSIAKPAIQAQTFVHPFKMERMTWIKPSFLWMMYRSGWATKENQERILAIRIKREGFEWALRHSCLSHFDQAVHVSKEEWRNSLLKSPTRIQWDPEKDIHLRPLSYRSIQIGLSGTAVHKYISEWILSIKDITNISLSIRECIASNEIDRAYSLMPFERHYPLSNSVASTIGAY